MDRSIAPAISSQVNLKMLPIQSMKLENNVELHIINGGSQEIVKVELIFNAGSKYQSVPLQAALAFDLLQEGTKFHPGNSFTEAMDLLGGFLSMETTKDYGTITLFVLNKYLSQALGLVQDMLVNPTATEKDFDRLIENHKNNYLINKEKSSFLAKQKQTERLYFGSLYNRVAVESSFDTLTYAEVISFLNEKVIGSPFKVLVSGKVSAKEEAVLKSGFGSMDMVRESGFVHPGEPSPQIGEFHIQKDTEQCSLSIGKILPNKDHKDTHKISIVNTIFGGYFGSRLMQNIREEKGWTYGISSGVFANENVASLSIGADVLKDKRVDTLNEIRNELAKLQNELVSDEELSLVRNYLKGKILKSFDGPFEQADRFFTINAFGLDWSFYNEYLETLDAITPKEVQEIARKYFKYEDLVIVSAGGE